MLRQSVFKTLKSGQALDPIAVTSAGGAKTSAAIDCSGWRKVKVTVCVGAEGDTLSGSVYDTITVTSSDASGGTYANVAAADIEAAQTVTSGVLAVVDAAADAAKEYNFSYTGKNDYLKVTITPTGTHTNGTIFGVNYELMDGDDESFPVTTNT